MCPIYIQCLANGNLVISHFGPMGLNCLALLQKTSGTGDSLPGAPPTRRSFGNHCGQCMHHTTNIQMGVSENRGTPKSSIFHYAHYKPSILGYLCFWKHPNRCTPGPSSFGCQMVPFMKGEKIHHFFLGFFIGTQTGRCWQIYPNVKLDASFLFSSRVQRPQISYVYIVFVGKCLLISPGFHLESL